MRASGLAVGAYGLGRGRGGLCPEWQLAPFDWDAASGFAVGACELGCAGGGLRPGWQLAPADWDAQELVFGPVDSWLR